MHISKIVAEADQFEKYALADHSSKANHENMFSSTELLFKSNSYWKRMILEVLEIKLDPIVLNWDVGLQLSSTWGEAIWLLTGQLKS